MDFASSTFQKAAGAIRLSRRHKCRDSLIISICNHDRAGTCEEIVECELRYIGFIQTFGYTLDITRDQMARHREAEWPQAEQSQTIRLNPNSVRSLAISPSLQLRYQQYMRKAIICAAPFRFSDLSNKSLPPFCHMGSFSS